MHRCLYLTKKASYDDPNLKAVSLASVSQAVNEIGRTGGLSDNQGGHAVRAGAAQDADRWTIDRKQERVNKLW
jgi:transcription elongation GreA/GreB family factor